MYIPGRQKSKCVNMSFSVNCENLVPQILSVLPYLSTASFISRAKLIRTLMDVYSYALKSYVFIFAECKALNCSQLCDHENGRAICICREGYKMDMDNGTCIPMGKLIFKINK